MNKKPERRARQARMSDVAKAAGVSSITVSRALSAPDTVAPETRKRIADAIELVGYLGNSIAGSLKSRRTNLVIAVIPSITHQFLASMIQGISEVLGANGYHLVLATSGDSRIGEENVVRAFLPQRPCAIVLHNTEHTDDCIRLLKNSEVQIVETGDLTAAAPLGIAVAYSNFDASYAMTRHLVERGYKKIAFAYRQAEFNERTDERARGYRAAIADAGLAADDGLLIATQAGVGGGAQAIRAIVRDRPEIEAVFFTGNDIGAGAILECGRQGWPVPSRIAIAGYDDSDLAVTLTPTLTTLRIPRYEIGRATARAIVARLAGKPAEPRQDMGFDIIAREST